MCPLPGIQSVGGETHCFKAEQANCSDCAVPDLFPLLAATLEKCFKHSGCIRQLWIFFTCFCSAPNSTEICLCSRALLWPFPWHYGKAGLVAVEYTQCSFALFQLQEVRLWPGQEPGAIRSISRAVTSCLCHFSPDTARFTWPRTQGLPVLEQRMGKTIGVYLFLRAGCYWSITAGMGSPRDMCHAASFRVQRLRIKTKHLAFYISDIELGCVT